jgi:Restriction endonuclease
MTEQFAQRLEAGLQFEDYIADCYRSKGWIVFHRGRNRGGADLGIDLIAAKEPKHILVQCKRWTGFAITEIEIFAFYKACIAYKKRRATETKAMVFFDEPSYLFVFATTSFLTQEAHAAAIIGNILVREKVRFPPVSKVQFATTLTEEKLREIESDTIEFDAPISCQSPPRPTPTKIVGTRHCASWWQRLLNRWT